MTSDPILTVTGSGLGVILVLLVNLNNIIPIFRSRNYSMIRIVDYVFKKVGFLGRPKFKISQHPEGYSMQVGVSGYYMQLRFTNNGSSFHFDILNHKGSVRYRVNEWLGGESGE